MTRILVFLGATAGLMYNALWYFPLLMLLGGVASVIFDYRLLHPVFKWIKGLRKRNAPTQEENGTELPSIVSQPTSRKSEAKCPNPRRKWNGTAIYRFPAYNTKIRGRNPDDGTRTSDSRSKECQPDTIWSSRRL